MIIGHFYIPLSKLVHCTSAWQSKQNVDAGAYACALLFLVQLSAWLPPIPHLLLFCQGSSPSSTLATPRSTMGMVISLNYQPPSI